MLKLLELKGENYFKLYVDGYITPSIIYVLYHSDIYTKQG